MISWFIWNRYIRQIHEYIFKILAVTHIPYIGHDLLILFYRKYECLHTVNWIRHICINFYSIHKTLVFI